LLNLVHRDDLSAEMLNSLAESLLVRDLSKLNFGAVVYLKTQSL
jgi:hypothetical protein